MCEYFDPKPTFFQHPTLQICKLLVISIWFAWFFFFRNIEVVQKCGENMFLLQLLTGRAIWWRCRRGGGRLPAEHAGDGFTNAAPLVIAALEGIVGAGRRGLHGCGC